MNDIGQMNALDLGKMIKSRKVSVEEVVTMQLEVIKAREGDYKSYITIMEDEAYLQAKKVQKRIDNGELDLSPLAGVPVAVKDDISTKGVKTTAGSKSLFNYVPTYNASVIERLMDAGAIIIAKTNMDEFSLGNSFLPGGESFISLGSDAGGSIRQEAGYCGLIGIKPTYGTVSRYGLISTASSLEQIGILGRSVADCAAALDIISGHDPRDSTSIDKKEYNYYEGLHGDLKNMRIGIPNIYLGEGLQKDVRSSVDNAINTFRDMGAIVEKFDLPNLQYAGPAYHIIASAEASSNLARYDGVRYGYRTSDYDNLDDLYIKSRSESLGIEAKKRILYGNMILSAGNYHTYFTKAQKVRTLIIESFTKAFEKYDIIMGPTSPDTAPLVGSRQDKPLKKHLSDIYSLPVNLAGLPALSMPGAKDKKGLPIAIQLIGRPFGENDIFRAAHCFQQQEG